MIKLYYQALGLFLFLSLTVDLAHGNLKSKLEVETALQNRIFSIVKSIDPNAFVWVDVKLKKLTVSLPGTGVTQSEMYTSGLSQEFSEDDLESVKVSVTSKVEAFPEHVKKAIEETVQLGKIKGVVTYSVTDPSTAEFIEKNRLSSAMKDISEEAGQKFTSFLITGIVALLAALGLFTVALFVLSQKLRKVFELSFANMVKALEQGDSQRGSGPSPAFLPAPAASAQAAIAHTSGGESGDLGLHSLSLSTIVALFSDCYWTEKDSYAIWIWNHLSTEQRQALLETWSESANYLRAISHLPEANLKVHSHPSYFNPLDLSQVCNDNLAQWLREHPGAWGSLSPLRQATCPLSLEEKLKAMRAEALGVFKTKPKPSTTSRKLSQSLAISQISDEEEDRLFSDPTIVPPELRKAIPSLVWFALLELEIRRELISKISASDLATAWVGSPAVLGKLQEAVSEKKLKLLESYKKNTPSSRNSQVFQYLVAESLKYQEQEKKAA